VHRLQILYINFVSDVMPALALGLSRSEAGVMQRPPRDPEESILLHRHWVAIVGYGAVIAASVLGAFAVALLWLGMEPAHAVSVSFLTFGFARLWHVFNMRSVNSPVFINEITGNRFVWISIAIGILLLLAAAYIPVLAGVLSVHAPDIDGWLLCLAFSLLPLVTVQLMKMRGVLWEKPAHNNN
jgi:Ca2+-transporting ATPase